MKPSKRNIRRLIGGAMGEIKADLIISGGEMVNVYSGEILNGMEIAVLDGRICYVGPKAGHTRGPSTRLLDAKGLVIAPGFIDAHTHDDRLMLSGGDMAPKVSQGVTTVIGGNCGVSLAPKIGRAHV